MLAGCLGYAGQEQLNVSSLIGLKVTVDNSENCDDTGNAQAQYKYESKVMPVKQGGCSVTLNVTVKGLVEKQDAGYDFVYVNDVLIFSSEDEDLECEMLEKTETRQISVSPGDDVTLSYDTGDGQFHKGDEDNEKAYAEIIDVQVVDECGSCSASGSGIPGSLSAENECVLVRMGMGYAEFGKYAGNIEIYSETPSYTLYTPAGIRFSSPWEGVEVIEDANEDIRQILTPQGLADIVIDVQGVSYKIRFSVQDKSVRGTRTIASMTRRG